MMRNHSLTTCLASTLLLATSACKSAHEAAPAPQSAAQQVALEISVAPDDGRPKTDLLAAIAAAKASAPGLRLIGADLDTEEGHGTYSVVLVGGGKVHEISIDATDGKVGSANEGEMENDSQESLERMLPAQTTIEVEQLLATALAKVPGSWAHSVWPAQVDEQPAFCVVLMDDKADKFAYVSARDGKFLQLLDKPLQGEDEDENEGEEGMEMQEQQPAPPPAPPK